jgi:hypothetical protein
MTLFENYSQIYSRLNFLKVDIILNYKSLAFKQIKQFFNLKTVL